MDPVLLARAQFAANMSFHILFPTISIALGWMLLFFRFRWLKTRNTAWYQAMSAVTQCSLCGSKKLLSPQLGAARRNVHSSEKKSNRRVR